MLFAGRVACNSATLRDPAYLVGNGTGIFVLLSPSEKVGSIQIVQLLLDAETYFSVQMHVFISVRRADLSGFLGPRIS